MLAATLHNNVIPNAITIEKIPKHHCYPITNVFKASYFSTKFGGFPFKFTGDTSNGLGMLTVWPCLLSVKFLCYYIKKYFLILITNSLCI